MPNIFAHICDYIRANKFSLLLWITFYLRKTCFLNKALLQKFPNLDK